jgi:hypothetical protein
MTDDGAADDLDDLIASLKGPLDWRKVSEEDAPRLWAELREWVKWLRERYSLDHRVVPPCWEKHGALVDLLTALRDHHEGAFDPYQAPTAATEWHRVFRDIELRLREWAGRTSCSPSEHRPNLGVVE